MSLHDWKFHCAVLNIPEHASLKEIKEAYRKLAQRYHPDHNQGTHQANERFQRVNASYHYLTQNLASRPVSQAIPPPPAPTPAPTPLRWGWRRKNFSKKTSSLLSNFSLLLKRNSSTRWLVTIPALLGLVFLSVLQRTTNTPEPDTSVHSKNPDVFSEAKPNEKLDQYGRPISSCELLSFDHGKFIEKQKTEVSEVECRLQCNSWFSQNDSLDASCNWNKNEFEQHAANIPPRSLASQSANEAQRKTQDENPTPRFVPDSEPENEGDTPIVVRKIKLGEVHTINMEQVPVVWIGDTRILHGSMGINSRQVIIKPIRKGVTGVVFTDSSHRPFLKFIYNIE